MSGRFVWDIQTRGYGENCMSDATRTRMLQMACKTLHFYGYNAIFYDASFIREEKSKLNFVQIKRNLYHICFTLIISCWVFSCTINALHKRIFCIRQISHRSSIALKYWWVFCIDEERKQEDTTKASEIVEKKIPEPEKLTAMVEQDLKEDQTIESKSKDQAVDDKALNNKKIGEDKNKDKNEVKPAHTLSEGLSHFATLTALMVQGVKKSGLYHLLY